MQKWIAFQCCLEGSCAFLFKSLRFMLDLNIHVTGSQSIPCTNYSIDPGFWSQLTDCLDDDLRFRRQPASSAIPIGSTLVSVRHQTISSKSDLHTVQISHQRIWMRIRDPNFRQTTLGEIINAHLGDVQALA